jgi:membrane protein implicated in regulation of membrane protease activity
MVDRKTEIHDHFIHAGAGTGLAIVNLGALIPGFVPFLALTALVTFVLVAPFLILGLAGLLAAAPVYLTSRVVRRARRRRRHREETPPAMTARPVPLPHLS